MLAGVVHEEYAYLTTTGRVSGTAHEIEIWFATDGSTVWLISGGDERSDWVRNLLRDPRASVRIADVTLEVTARCAIADPAARQHDLGGQIARRMQSAAEAVDCEGHGAIVG